MVDLFIAFYKPANIAILRGALDRAGAAIPELQVTGVINKEELFPERIIGESI